MIALAKTLKQCQTIFAILLYAYFLIFEIFGWSDIFFISPKIGTKYFPNISISSSPLYFYNAPKIHKLFELSKFSSLISPAIDGGYIYKILFGPNAIKIECITLLNDFSSNSSLKFITSTINYWTWEKAYWSRDSKNSQNIAEVYFLFGNLFENILLSIQITFPKWWD